MRLMTDQFSIYTIIYIVNELQLSSFQLVMIRCKTNNKIE